MGWEVDLNHNIDGHSCKNVVFFSQTILVLYTFLPLHP